ncbi:pyrroline-5-carboxylate reductase [Iodidimonas gelatinilytica]|uniref:Pyrroline-5-carboxylate reductase n=1 Tax=Iodidimonas gelatinilytica TaxID=1236966 RepID=A0A5A7N1N0_9PROT|nr:pyrroline-5-carboxylate reductase [Iodidimonas gelatinilytica]GER01250.1 pyrroline-5-carboxylate reductase [Iodidimonas gelatinilytica]
MDLSKTFDPQHPLVLVGCGRMGGAMARGWLERGLAPEAFVAIDPAGEPDFAPDARHFSSIDEMPRDLAPAAVILAVKPYMVGEAVEQLAHLAEKDPLVISVAAGIQLASLAAVFESSVRVMPNTPAAIGKGMMVAVAANAVSQAKKSLASDLMAAAGDVLWVDDESMMDAVTGVSGSGPAYIFALTEAMAAAGVVHGLPHDVASQLARQTIIGAAHLMEQSPHMTASELREQVTSPGGTTAAALDILRGEEGFGPLLEKAIGAATRRSQDLAK